MNLQPRLVKLAGALNERSRELSDRVSQIEGVLKRIALGVEAWTPMPQHAAQFGYCKVAGAWHLAIRDDRNLWALAESPRVMRVESITLLSSLLEALANEAESMEVEMRAATKTAESFMEAIRAAAAEVNT